MRPGSVLTVRCACGAGNLQGGQSATVLAHNDTGTFQQTHTLQVCWQMPVTVLASKQPNQLVVAK